MTVRDRTTLRIKETRDVIDMIEARVHETGDPMPPGIQMGLDSLRKVEREMMEELAEMDREAARRKDRRLAQRAKVNA